MNKQNYQLVLEKTLKDIERAAGEKGVETPPSLLMHCCCAPCSSYCLEYLNRYFSITAYYYNPNISPKEEYDHRVGELRRLWQSMPLVHEAAVMEGPYEPEVFEEMAEGLTNVPEGGERCRRCYEMRLRQTARAARDGGYDYFTTTLSISPLKRADWLNEIGGRLSEEFGVPYLYSDFKKKGGYQRSIELSAIYGLYRQDYCGCVYSRRERDARVKDREKSALQMQ